MAQASTSIGLVMMGLMQTYVAPDPEIVKQMQRQREIQNNPEKVIGEK
jgi:hypothetical protein